MLIKAEKYNVRNNVIVNDSELLHVLISSNVPLIFWHTKRNNYTDTQAAAAQLDLDVRGLLSWLRLQLAMSTIIRCQHCASGGGIKLTLFCTSPDVMVDECHSV